MSIDLAGGTSYLHMSLFGVVVLQYPKQDTWDPIRSQSEGSNNWHQGHSDWLKTIFNSCRNSANGTAFPLALENVPGNWNFPKLAGYCKHEGLLIKPKNNIKTSEYESWAKNSNGHHHNTSKHDKSKRKIFPIAFCQTKVAVIWDAEFFARGMAEWRVKENQWPLARILQRRTIRTLDFRDQSRLEAQRTRK